MRIKLFCATHDVGSKESEEYKPVELGFTEEWQKTGVDTLTSGKKSTGK